MTTSAKFWDNISEKYAKAPVRQPLAYEQTLDRVRTYLEPQHEVLELGCGTGSTALTLSENVQRITATDLAEGMISIARQKAAKQGVENVEFRQCSALGEGIGEGRFDVVMAFNLFHLLPNLEHCLAASHKLLKPGGLFISKTPCLSEANPLFRVLVPAMRLIGKAPYVRFLGVFELEGLVKNAGFKILETGNYPVKPPSRLIVAQKL
ncbi:class I SAM-dependent methyltransferase [Pseudovibrio exalbescens]|uniref:class I SAM-dependent methyltransferase n=1 Tax=Pseudovibrio exalbescens TaxID=197461 RepID=UPI002365C270|nr:class I SAM-dependent methyltransferase [Pseudovibrio exalbescens]MDD7911791.1 class I SAM-dependent methyltransferase [Pseudovibrio exalbescens]